VGAKFDDFAVIVSGSVDEDSLWVSSAKEFVKVRVIERRIKMEFRGVLIEERVVGLGDSDDLDVGAVEGVGEESLRVAVNEPGNGDTERRFGVGGVKCVCGENRRSEEKSERE
jgi:hypothetical protein